MSTYRGKPVNIQGRQPLDVDVVWTASTTSAAVNMHGATAGLRIYLPVDFAGSALTFTELAADGVTWAAVYRDGVAVTETVTAGKWNVISAFGELFGCDQIKIVSDQTETGRGTLRGAG